MKWKGISLLNRKPQPISVISVADKGHQKKKIYISKYFIFSLVTLTDREIGSSIKILPLSSAKC